jgi:2-amino-4-hydroxy-6-hydroxymethyldihydropteridine diphosphokinase
MEPVRVFLGLGSNLGDRGENLRRALELLGRDVALEKCSSIYDTAPWGYEDQGRFLNCVCEGRTGLAPRALLKAVKRVEGMVGRRPTFANGPRIIDVDILFYGECVVSEAALEIPHPGLVERAFVLVPLREIAAGYIHPVLNLTVSELAERLDQKGGGGALGASEAVKLWGGPIPVARVS